MNYFKRLKWIAPLAAIVSFGFAATSHASTSEERGRFYQDACQRLLTLPGGKDDPIHTQKEALDAGQRFSVYFRAVDKEVLERSYLVRLVEIALIAKEHLLVAGSPGNAKSKLANIAFENLTEADGKPSYFTDQMTSETTLSDTHGYVDFRKMDQEGEIVRRYQDGILGARVAFLDEIFDIGPKALRNILGALNERAHKRHQGKTWSVISASNRYISEVYERFGGGKDAQAVLDRYAFAAYVPADFEKADNYRKLIQGVKSSGVPRTVMPELTFQEIEKLQALLPEIQIPDHVAHFIANMVYRMRPEVEAMEESSRREREAKIQGGESALPSWRSTKLMSLRTTAKSANVLKAIIALEWLESGGKRALIANLDDIRKLEIFFTLNGPRDEFVQVELDRSTDPHERAQLETIMKERLFFRELYKELTKEFNDSLSTYPLSKIAEDIQSFKNMMPWEQKEALLRLRELYFTADVRRITEETDEYDVSPDHIANTSLFESVHEWLVMIKGERGAKETLEKWEKEFTEEDRGKLQEKLNPKPTEPEPTIDPTLVLKDSDNDMTKAFMRIVQRNGADAKIIGLMSAVSLKIVATDSKGKTVKVGSNVSNDSLRFNNETEGTVKLTYNFASFATPATQGMWGVVWPGKNPAKHKLPEYSDGDHNRDLNGEPYNVNHPIENTTLWSEMIFYNKLSEGMGLAPAYDLSKVNFKGAGTPAEIEALASMGALEATGGTWRYTSKSGRAEDTVGWRHSTDAEYSIMAEGSNKLYRQYPSGDGKTALDQDGWHSGNSDNRTHAVGMKSPDANGRTDMVGNVWVRVIDAWTENPPGGQNPVNENFDAPGPSRGVRAGSFVNDAQNCRLAARYGMGSGRYEHVGLRPVRTLK